MRLLFKVDAYCLTEFPSLFYSHIPPREFRLTKTFSGDLPIVDIYLASRRFQDCDFVFQMHELIADTD